MVALSDLKGRFFKGAGGLTDFYLFTVIGVLSRARHFFLKGYRAFLGIYLFG